MVFKIILTVILFIALITLMYNVIIGVRNNDDKLIVLCGISSGLIGLMFGIALGSILFNM